VVAVVAELVEEPVRAGMHLQQPVHAPFGFVEDVGDVVGAVEAAGLLPVSKDAGENDR